MFTAQPRLMSALALLLALVLSVRASIVEQKKSLVPDSQLGPKLLYYIKDGQCSGYLTDICPGSVVLGVEVRVVDPTTNEYPKVVVEDSLRSVLVYRSGACKGQVDIELRRACSGPTGGLGSSARSSSQPPFTLLNIHHHH